MMIEADGFAIEGSTASRSYLEALRDGKAEAFMSRLFRQAVKPGMNVVDVGAFLGQYTLLAAQQVGPRGHVYAFEPDPRTVPFLERNLERNGLRDRVTTVPHAVAERSGLKTLNLDPEVGSGSSLFFRRRRSVDGTSVRCVALDEFLDPGIVVDVVKLDVEGGELRALQGMEQTIRRASARLTMFVECFPRGLHSAGASTRALVERLEALGFTVSVIDERRGRLFPIKSGAGSLWHARFQLYLGLNSLLLSNLLCVRSPSDEIFPEAYFSGAPASTHRSSRARSSSVMPVTFPGGMIF